MPTVTGKCNTITTVINIVVYYKANYITWQICINEMDDFKAVLAWN